MILEGATVIRITDTIAIREQELGETFIRASGPGGQNVNAVSTAVQLRFDARQSPSLPDAVYRRLFRLDGSRVTYGGVIVITARRFRTQDANRRDALNRLVELIREAATPPKKRKSTKPPRASVRRRLEIKGRRSALKKARGTAPIDD
jgi:ribosome-associated protein